MSDDRAALIAEAREFAERSNGLNWQGRVRELADALEASVQAPAPGTPAAHLTDALVVLDDLHPNGEVSYNAYSQLHDLVSLALGAVHSPAVDREVLSQVLAAVALRVALKHDGGLSDLYDKQADALIASGILQDAAEVEARGLEKAAFSGHFGTTAQSTLLRRAQQVRAGK